MVIISETFLYLFFSILVGTFILNLVPVSLRPKIQVPKWLILLSIVGIAVLSFAPVLQLIINLGKNLGFWRVFNVVLTSFDMGKAWIFTFLVAILLFILCYLVDVEKQKPFLYLALGLVFILILSQGWASHSKSIEQWKGLLAHSLHFLAVTLWVGIVMVVGWFAQNTENWRKFLGWFTPVAIVCVSLVVLSGFMIMSFVLALEDYATSWVLPFGQALLFKHLLIIPLLVFAFVNGFLMQRRLKLNESFNPIPWTKAEGLVLLLVFSATAALGQQAPPHTISQTLNFIAPSAIYQWFHPGEIDPNIVLTPLLSTSSVVLLAVALGLLISTVIFFRKKLRPIYAISTSLLFVILSYVVLMTSV